MTRPDYEQMGSKGGRVHVQAVPHWVLNEHASRASRLASQPEAPVPPAVPIEANGVPIHVEQGHLDAHLW